MFTCNIHPIFVVVLYKIKKGITLLMKTNKQPSPKKHYPFTRKAFSFYAAYKKQTIFVLILSFIGAGTSLITPFLSAQLITNISIFNFENILKIMLVFVGLSLFDNILYYFLSFIYGVIARKVNYDMKKKYLYTLTTIQTKHFDKENSGAFSKRLGDIGSVSDFFIHIIDSISVTFADLAFIVYLSFLNIYIGLAFLIGLSIYYVIENKRIKVFTTFNKNIRSKTDKTRGDALEVVRGVREIKSLNLQDAVLERVNSRRYALLDEKKGFYKKYYILNRVIRVYKTLFWAAIVILAAYLVVQGQFLQASLLIMYNYMNRALRAVDLIINIKERFAKNEVSAERVFEVLNNTKYASETFGTKNIDALQGKIEFKDVTFSYDEKPLFENLNFTIQPNKTVAFVGKSGQGKSTILSLISKMYDVQSGNVLLDDIPLNDLSKETIRGNISYVMQQPYIFNVSVKENLLFANKNATEQELVEACKKAQIHDYIMELPNQYDSVLGEDGIIFSGGQKQRLAIARALLKNSKILLFDEATSSLDNESQNKIKQVIHTLSKDHTIIIVAHRLSTVVDSNQIFVMQDHKIVDSGTHKQLLKNCLLYKNLYTSSEEE